LKNIFNKSLQTPKFNLELNHCNIAGNTEKDSDMNFTTTTQVSGTSLRGGIQATYDQLVAVFGQPEVFTEENSDGKIDVEWVIAFDNGTVATIYNWKNGKNYCGADGLNVADITQWNVGGNRYDSAALVEEALKVAA